MKIGIDARALRVKGGSKVYAENLLKDFKDKQRFILFGVDKFENFKCINNLIRNDSILRLYYENIMLPKLMKEENLKVIHGLKGVVPYFGKFKKIVTIHDIIPLIYPEQFKFKDLVYWKFIFPSYVRKADKIIAVSETTKRDLIKLLNINEEKIVVIYEAQDKDYKIIKDKKKLELIRNKYSLHNPFLFYSGSINPRKNLKRVIKSFEEIQDKINVDLVITGGTIWKSDEEMEMIKKNKRIKTLGFVPKEDLIALYNLAEIYLYPSLYEGFGLPILEAQSCGCPVITSNISSMPEVAGEGAILINPENTKEIVTSIKKIFEDINMRRNLIRKGFENIKRFSWEKCARETEKIYEEVYNE